MFSIFKHSKLIHHILAFYLWLAYCVYISVYNAGVDFLRLDNTVALPAFHFILVNFLQELSHDRESCTNVVMCMSCSVHQG
jgi:hypothetical protein